MKNVTSILNNFQPVSLADIERASLMDRIELKYLLPVAMVPAIIEGLQKEYYVLEINGIRQPGYTTRYFDSAGFRLYLDHHNGYSNRIKIRQRLYESTGDCFFEIKRKVNGGRTEKIRTAIDNLYEVPGPGLLQALPYPRLKGEPLQMILTNTFERITLADKQLNERITIDTDITVSGNGNTRALQNLALLEVKQPRPDLNSPALRILRQFHLHAVSFSKYAIGVALLFPDVKRNNLKPVLLKIEKWKTKLSQ